MSANVPVRHVYFVFKAESTEGEQGQMPGTARATERDAPPKAGEPAEDAGDSDAEGESSARSSRPELSWPEPGALAVDLEDERSFAGEFTVVTSGQYYFQMEGVEGFRSFRPDSFRVEAVPDRKPLVRIILPETETERVSPEASVRIRVSASDDYGVETGSIDGLFFPGLGPESEVRAIPLPGLEAGAEPDTVAGAGQPGGERAVSSGPGESRESEILLDVASLSGKPGEVPAPGARFQYRARARDLAGNLGESQLHLLEIVEKEELLRDLNDQLTIVRDQLREIERRQVSARKDVLELEGGLAASGTVGPEDAQRLVRHQQDQLRISQALERQVAEIDRLLDRSEQNRVGDEKWRAWTRSVRNDLSFLALGKSRGVERSIESLRKEALEAPQEIGRLSLVQALQREVEREIEALVLQLSDFGDMNAVIRMLREVRRRQVELRDETRTRVGGVEPEEP